ncbi:MAG: acyltransferase family protein [Gallionellaceae bacterium]
MTIDKPPSHPNADHLTHPKYRSDIDGLRAIAILSVVGFHAFPLLIPGGFIGVDVFFVISGYLISTIIVGSLERNSFSFVEFYRHRIRRIFPAQLLVLFACLVFGWFELLSDEYKQLGKHIAGGAGFILNFLLWNESGYFDNAAETKPLLHLWTLGVEEQFYIIWPLLLWIAWKIRFNPLTATLSVAAISFALNIDYVRNDAVAAFYSPQTRFWELMAGSALAYMSMHKQHIYLKFKHRLGSWLDQMVHSRTPEANGKTLRNAQSLSGAVLIAIGVLVITKDKDFPGWWALLPTLGTVLIISSGAQAWLNRAVLSNRMLVWFGLISYPLYLWHWPLLSFAQIIEGETPALSIRIVLVLISIMFAWLTYGFIEKPIRFGRHKNVKTLSMLVLMGIVGYAGYSVYRNDGFPFRAVQQDSFVASGEFNYLSQWKGWQDCDYVETDPGIGGCRALFSANSGSNRAIDLAVIGDSHAGHLAAGLKDIFKNRPENLAVMLHAACYPFFTETINGEEYFKCWNNLIDNAMNFSIQSPTIRTVILSGYAAVHIEGNRFYQNKTTDHEAELMNSEAFEAAMGTTLARLTAANKHVIYIVDNPELYKDPKGCVKRPFFTSVAANYCSIARKDYEQRTRLYRAIVNRAKDKFPSVDFIDTSNIFCGQDKCSGIMNGTLLYATRDHLSPSGSRFLLNAIAPNIFKYIDDH